MRCASVGAGREKRPSDFFRRERAHFAKREGHLRVGRERRMAAREDQPEPIVLDALLIGPCRLVDDRDVQVVARFVERLESGAPAQAVDRLEATG